MLHTFSKGKKVKTGWAIYTINNKSGTGSINQDILSSSSS